MLKPKKITKNLFYLVAFLFFANLFLDKLAPSLTLPKHDFKLENDSVLLTLIQNLPADWQVLDRNNTILIEKKTAIYVLFENRINAPNLVETASARSQRIQKYGKKINLAISFSFVPHNNEQKQALSQKGISFIATEKYLLFSKKYNFISDPAMVIFDPAPTEQEWFLVEDLIRKLPQ